MIRCFALRKHIFRARDIIQGFRSCPACDQPISTHSADRASDHQESTNVSWETLRKQTTPCSLQIQKVLNSLQLFLLNIKMRKPLYWNSQQGLCFPTGRPIKYIVVLSGVLRMVFQEWGWGRLEGSRDRVFSTFGNLSVPVERITISPSRWGSC